MKHQIKYSNILIKTYILSIIFFTLKSQDYSFYYNNNKDEITFYSNNNIDIKIIGIEIKSNSKKSFISTDILNEFNIIKKYNSKADNGEFIIECYNIYLSNISINLVKIIFDTPDSHRITEVIVELNNSEANKIICPKKYYDDFIVIQSKQASADAHAKKGEKIYDIFGFDIKTNSNYNFKVKKILLVNYKKKQVNYLANLSDDISTSNYSYNYFRVLSENDNLKDMKGKTYVFYLKNLPEDFDLHITLNILDNDKNIMESNVLIIQKNFIYPNYKIEYANPNKRMFITSICFILFASILTVIFAIIKLLFH